MILLILLSNVLSIYENNQDLPATDYRKAQQVIKGRTHDERMEFFQEKKDELRYFENLNIDKEDLEYYLTSYGKEWMDRVRKMDVQDVYPIKIMERLEKEEENLVGYDQFLDNVAQQYKMNSSISIFQDDDAFVKSRAFKTKELYKKMEIQMPNSSTGSYGIELLLQNKMVDIFIMIFLCYLLYQCVVKEDEEQHIQYMNILAKGKIHLFLTKCIAIWLSIGLLAVITYGTLYINLSLQYGLSNCLNPIQSILSCLQFPYDVSILTFLGIVLLNKLFVYLFFSVLLYVLYFVFRRYLIAIVGFLSICSLSTLLAQITAGTNTVFSFLSPSILLAAHVQLIKVSYIRVFSYAIPFWICYIILGFVIAILLGIGYKFFIKKRHQKKKKKDYIHVSTKLHSLTYYEFKKIWVKDAGIIILIFFFIAMGTLLLKSENLTNTNDLKYNYYIDTMGNHVNQQLEEKVGKEERRFLHLNEQAMKEKNQVKLEEIYNELAIEPGFYIYKERIELIKASDESHLLIKDDQTRFIFNNDTMYSYIGCSYMLMLILLCMKCYERDYKSNVIMMQKMNESDGKKIKKIKFLSVTLVTILTVILMNVIPLLYHQSQYPDMSYTTYFNDIPAYFESGIHLPVGIILLLQSLWQVVCVFLLTYAFTMLFSYTRYNKFVMIVLVIAFALPTLFVPTLFNKLAWTYYLLYPWRNISYAVYSFIALLCMVGCIYYFMRRRKFE